MRYFPVKYYFFFLILFFRSHGIMAQVSEKAINDFLNDSAVRTGHAGISIYELSSKKYLYNFNADKNFMPSSNVKLFTLYAGMKYLGDSILALNVFEKADTTYFQTTADPTFLHRDFPDQPAFRYLEGRKNYLINSLNSRDDYSRFASGWAFEDYTEDYMAERSRFSIYGNVVSFSGSQYSIVTIPDISRNSHFDLTEFKSPHSFKNISISRAVSSNRFFRAASSQSFRPRQIPFLTNGEKYMFSTPISLLADSLHVQENSIHEWFEKYPWRKIYSRPVDSLFRPMMHNSDNFFAEQTLLMVSDAKFGYINDSQILDTLLINDFKDIPTTPRWVDGSGLSRYNLFSPEDFIYILEKLNNEFGWARIKHILPTAGQGTLKNLYDGAAGYIFAKTGSMSNNVALSGYLITKKNKTFLFSIILNNINGTNTAGRRAIEKFLLNIRETN